MSQSTNNPTLSNYNLPTLPLGKNGSTGSPYVGNNHADSKSYVVPEFKAISYTALTHGTVPTYGYHNITTAYSNTKNCFDTYRLKMINQ